MKTYIKYISTLMIIIIGTISGLVVGSYYYHKAITEKHSSWITTRKHELSERTAELNNAHDRLISTPITYHTTRANDVYKTEVANIKQGDHYDKLKYAVKSWKDRNDGLFCWSLWMIIFTSLLAGVIILMVIILCVDAYL